MGIINTSPPAWLRDMRHETGLLCPLVHRCAQGPYSSSCLPCSRTSTSTTAQHLSCVCPLEEASAVCTNSTCSAQEECVCLCLSSSVSACCHGRVCDAHGKKGFAFILLAKVTQPGFLYLLSCMGLLSHGLTPFRKLKSPVMTSGCLLSVG